MMDGRTAAAAGLRSEMVLINIGRVTAGIGSDVDVGRADAMLLDASAERGRVAAASQKGKQK